MFGRPCITVVITSNIEIASAPSRLQNRSRLCKNVTYVNPECQLYKHKYHDSHRARETLAVMHINCMKNAIVSCIMNECLNIHGAKRKNTHGGGAGSPA